MPHITSRLDFRNLKHLVSVLSWRILHFVDNSERVGRQKYRTKPLRFGDFVRLEVSESLECPAGADWHYNQCGSATEAGPENNEQLSSVLSPHPPFPN